MGANQSRSHFSIKQLLVQSLAVLFIGTTLFLLISISIAGIYKIWYADRIFPGISIDDVGVGGMTIEQAAGHLNNRFELTENGKITLWYEDHAIEVTPEQIGISLDWQTSIIEAYNYGRQGSFSSWFAYMLAGNFSEHNLTPTIILDQVKAQSALAQISTYYDQPAREANLYLQGTQVVTEAGQVGKELDITAGLEQIHTQTRQLNLEQIILPVIETNPQILDASPFASTAQEILNKALTLTLSASGEDAERSWRIDAEELAPMLTFEKVTQGDQTVLIPRLKEDFIDAYLDDLAQQIEIGIENPRFIFNDETRELDLLSGGVAGLFIDLEATKAAINEALQTGSASAEVAVYQEAPQVSDLVTGQELGINRAGPQRKLVLLRVQRSAHSKHRDGRRAISRFADPAQFHFLHGRSHGRDHAG